MKSPTKFANDETSIDEDDPSEWSHRSSERDLSLLELTVRDGSIAHVPAIKAVPEATFWSECPPITDSEGRTWIFMRIQAEDQESVRVALENDQTISNFDVMAEFADICLYRLLVNPEAKLLSPIITKEGDRLLTVQSISGGIRYRILVSNQRTVGQLCQFLDSHSIDYSIERIYTLTEWPEKMECGLTLQQRELLETARDLGYFDVPRNCTQQELADVLGVTRATASIRIRRVIRNLIETAVNYDMQ